MTDLQRIQFNNMRNALIVISRKYMTTNQIRKQSEKDYGLDYEEALEMAYENVQSIAKEAVKGVKSV